MPTTGSPRVINLPVYSKLSQIILGIIGFFFILYVGQDILMPLVFSVIFAILLNPAVNYFCGKGLNRVLSILIVLAVAFLSILGILYFLGMQLSMFTESLPQFKEHFTVLINDAINWVSAKFNIPQANIDAWVLKIKKDGMERGPSMIGDALGTVSGVLAIVFLLPVYMFTMLYYKPLLLEFVAELFKKKEHALVAEVLSETKILIQSYLMGLLIEMILVAAMNSIGLMIIGVKYGLLIGIIGAILNLIPYIGGIIAILLPVLMALATGNNSQAIWSVALYLVVQFIDNNLIVTKIVASKVKINALISIVVVLIGGALWGVSGMFLSIPITAIVKVVFDRIEPLKPFGFLLGDNQPDVSKVIFQFKKKRAPKTEEAK
ncbi:AI-2E family transporter [Sediminibacterium roseum]|uniref:AI-2E family transporter n=1 Tax=Sediminibacterium roseum TaxID=1978412 RepID=A0ABW9ZZF7_9BACT|nr:AI-2E family transporter [Sediminibacterium roseum]NCI50271.1 AI-2E family transporter [Sediminibacterium roseum]